MNRSRYRMLLLLGLISACGGADASNLATAVIDTLPGGIPRVTSPAPTAWSDSSGARIVEEMRWSGDDGSTAELGQPQSMAVDEAGRVYVVDRKPAMIKVFAPDGALIRTIGREGEGPGEFRLGFVAVRQGHLVLHDPQVARTSVWDTAGTFLRSWHSSCCYWTDIQIDSRQRIYIPSIVTEKAGESSRGNPYVRWSLEGVILDTVWVPRREPEKYWTVSAKGPDGKVNSSMSTGIPFMPDMTHAMHPDSGIVHGWTGAYSIVRSGTGIDSLRIFGRTWTPEKIDDARRRAELEANIAEPAKSFGEANVRAAFRLEDLPSSLPAFMNLRVDRQGRTWVRRFPPADTTGTTFDLFDTSGVYLGPVRIPFKMNEWGLQAWTEDGVVTIIEDENGRPTVVRLRLVY